MQRTVDSALDDIDGVLFVLSARERIGAGDRFIAQRVFALGAPVVIALNKVDRLKPGHIATQMTTGVARSATSTRCIRSARRRATASTSSATSSSGSSPKGRSTSRRSSARTSRSRRRSPSSIREKALALTRDEVPHAITVEVEEIDGQGASAPTSSSRRSRRSRSSSAAAGRWSGRSERARAPRSSSSSAARLPRAARQGEAALAARRVDARAARHLER